MSRRRESEFADLSVSVIQAVKAQYKNKEEANAVLKQLVGTVPSEREQRRYLAELAEYQALGEETILRVLKENAWDVEQAIIPLWNLLSEANSRANRGKAHTILQELFQTISKETIQMVLEKHDGDVDAASQELLRFVAKTEEKKESPEDKRRRERQEVVETMAKRFPNITKEECTRALERVNWSLQDAVHLILRKMRDTKVEAFKAQYPSLSSSEILSAIEGNDFNGNKTKENLEALVGLKAANKAPATQPSQADGNLMQEAIRIGGQIDQFIAAQQPETLAAVALQTTMRIGNRPGALTSLDAQTNGTEPAGGNAAAAAAAGAGMEFSLVTLVVSSKSVAKGEAVEVEWSHSQEPTTNDWIGMYKDGDDNNAYLAYNWVDIETKKSTFHLPSACGSYNFRYFHNRTYTSYGISEHVIVGPQFTVVPVAVTPTDIKIRVEQKTGDACPNLWVGFYADGQPVKSYLTFEWAKVGEEITFQVPKAGSWNFKVFPDKGYDYATSFSTLVQGTDTLDLFLDTENNKARVEFNVTTVDPRMDGVWIGIFNVEQEDSRYYRRYKNISEHKGFFEVKAMQTAGTYEARLFANGTYQVLCASKTKVTVP